MPFKYRKLPKKDLYKVYNAETKKVYSKGTTLENAKAQIRLLNAQEKKKLKGGSLQRNRANLQQVAQRIFFPLNYLRQRLYSDNCSLDPDFVDDKFEELRHLKFVTDNYLALDDERFDYDETLALIVRARRIIEELNTALIRDRDQNR